MSKQSGYLKRLQAEQRRRRDTDTAAIMQQQTLDTMVLALAEEFGFGPARFKRLRAAFESKWAEIVALAKEGERDGDLSYAKAVIDRALEKAVGPENFKPWEERYGG